MKFFYIFIATFCFLSLINLTFGQIKVNKIKRNQSYLYSTNTIKDISNNNYGYKKLKDYYENLYTISMGVGTPPQNLQIMLDTGIQFLYFPIYLIIKLINLGSSNFWVDS